MIIQPAPVHAGDTVYLAHVAGFMAADAVQDAVGRLESLGFTVRWDRALGQGPKPYLAASDDARRADLVAAIEDPTVGAVIAARGGYGSTRILDGLPRDLLRRHPKWLVGFSDVTALHCWATAQGVASLHGPAGVSVRGDLTDPTNTSLVRALAGAPTPLAGLQTVSPGRCTGQLVGGNLTLVAALIGTRYLPSLRGKVLLLEDVGEADYRLDRALMTLRQDGRAAGLAGVVLGQFTRCGGPDDPPDAAATRVAEEVATWGVPVVAGAPVGHGDPNQALVLGVDVDIDAERGTVLPADMRRQVHRVPAFLRRRATAAEQLAEAVADGVGSGAQLVVSEAGVVTHAIHVGTTARTFDAARATVGPHTRFDLASLTKALCTAVLAHRAVELGVVALDAACPADLSASRPTPRDLLRHSTGLPAHLRVYEEAWSTPDPAAFTRARFAAVEVDPAAIGRPCYSDVGYIALGRWVERALGADLATLFRDHIADRLGLDTIGFLVPDPLVDRDLPVAPDQLAATEWRERKDRPDVWETVQGTVDDENCEAMGGVAGHAGLFGTGAAVDAVARCLLGYGPPILRAASVERMWSRDERVPDGTFTLGWDTPSGARSNAGQHMTRDATVGHLGFTGTSLWIDRAREVSIVLLTNRVHPTRDDTRIRALRPAIHDAVMRELGHG